MGRDKCFVGRIFVVCGGEGVLVFCFYIGNAWVDGVFFVVLVRLFLLWVFFVEIYLV